MSTVLCEVFVPGRPRPKGSMKCMGANHHMEEDNPDSKPWRAQMARLLVLDRDRRTTPLALAPYYAEVDVSIVAFFPEGGPKPGDVDKLARNVLDALQDSVAGSPAVLADDAQVVGLFSERVFGAVGAQQGAWIRVATVEREELERRRMLRSTAWERWMAETHRFDEETGF